MSIQVEREDAKGAKAFFSFFFFFFFFFFCVFFLNNSQVCKKLDDAGLCKQLVEHLTAIGNLCKKLKAEKAVGAQKFQWKMIRQPVVWRVVLPEKVVEFEANFELWGDGKPGFFLFV